MFMTLSFRVFSVFRGKNSVANHEIHELHEKEIRDMVVHPQFSFSSLSFNSGLWVQIRPSMRSFRG